MNQRTLRELVETGLVGIPGKNFEQYQDNAHSLMEWTDEELGLFSDEEIKERLFTGTCEFCDSVHDPLHKCEFSALTYERRNKIDLRKETMCQQCGNAGLAETYQ